MVSIQEKIRNLSMGIAVSSIMSTGAVHAQEQHQPDKFPQAIEKTDTTQYITPPTISYSEALSGKETKTQFVSEYIQGLGDLYWISQGITTPPTPEEQDKTIKNIVKKGFIIHRKTPIISLIPSYAIDKLKQNEISLKTDFPESYKRLQKDDYLKVCRYQTTETLAQTCLALAKEQPEKINKLLPNLSKFIAENCPTLSKNDNNTSFSIEDKNTLQKHIMINFNKIAPNFDQEMEQNYNLSDSKTIKKLTPEGFYLMVNPDYPIDFKSQNLQEPIKQTYEMINMKQPTANTSINFLQQAKSQNIR